MRWFDQIPVPRIRRQPRGHLFGQEPSPSADCGDKDLSANSEKPRPSQGHPRSGQSFERLGIGKFRSPKASAIVTSRTFLKFD